MFVPRFWNRWVGKIFTYSWHPIYDVGRITGARIDPALVQCRPERWPDKTGGRGPLGQGKARQSKAKQGKANKMAYLIPSLGITSTIPNSGSDADRNQLVLLYVEFAPFGLCWLAWDRQGLSKQPGRQQRTCLFACSFFMNMNIHTLDTSSYMPAMGPVHAVLT